MYKKVILYWYCQESKQENDKYIKRPCVAVAEKTTTADKSLVWTSLAIKAFPDAWFSSAPCTVLYATLGIRDTHTAALVGNNVYLSIFHNKVNS